MLVTSRQMKTAEEAAFAAGSTPEELMEVAGEGIVSCLRQFFPSAGTVIVYCGKGHNGGDALVVARHLSESGWRVILRLAVPPEEMAPLTRQNLSLLQDAKIHQGIPQTRGPLLLLDGLLGIGATGAPRGATAELIDEINLVRKERGASTVAVDLPSGLDANSGEIPGACVQADFTVTLGAVKAGLVSDTATPVVGRLAVVPLPGLAFPMADSASVITAEIIRPLLPVRNYDSFKGSYGRIGILAGSPGFLGAARLCSAAAVHAGGGLVTLYVLDDTYELLAGNCAPEVMVQRVDSYLDVLKERNDVLALGPGLSRRYDQEVRRLISESPLPCVVDADALNAVSTDDSILAHAAGARLLTPHPGEMERLEVQAGRSRREWAAAFVKCYPVTLLLKGSRTIIAQHDSPLAFNSTGNPGMGSGGMGDVLTGVCGALIGGGHSPRDAAMLGAWLCGRAAEIAVFNRKESQESLSATSVIDHLGSACSSLRNGDY